jgi:hypothetical protein
MESKRISSYRDIGIAALLHSYKKRRLIAILEGHRPMNPVRNESARIRKTVGM